MAGSAVAAREGAVEAEEAFFRERLFCVPCGPKRDREAGIPKRIEAPYCPYEGAALGQGSVCFLGWQLGGT